MSTAATPATQTKPRAKVRTYRQRVDAALRDALALHTDSEGRWQGLRSSGATDNEIYQALKREFGEGGSSQTEEGVQYAYADGGSFTSPPQFWVDCGTHYTNEKPTLSGAALVGRVRELMQIPAAGGARKVDLPDELLRAGWELRSEGENKLYAQVERDGKLDGMTTLHSTLAEVVEEATAIQERRAGADRVGTEHPRRDSAYWRKQAAAMTKRIQEKLRPYDAPGKKTLKKIELYEGRVADGLDWQRWQATLINVADVLDEGELPPILFGLSNDSQVRRLMSAPFPGQPFTNMGPTIKTFEDFVAAHEALKPLIPAMLEDPNLDPREGTEWAKAVSAEADELGSHAEGDEAERQRLIAERGGQVNESGVYVEGVETVSVEVPKKSGSASLEVVQDRVDGQWRAGCHYTVKGGNVGGRAPWFDNGYVVGQPFDTREEALAAAAHEVAQSAPTLGSYMERYVESLGVAMPAESVTASASAAPATTGDVVETPATDSAPDSPRTFKDFLEVRLNNDDVADKGRKAALLALQISELEAEKKETDAAYKKKIGGLEEERDKLLRQIREGRDELELEVYERRDFDNHVVETVRADSQEVVATRAMKATEYQMPLVAL